MFSLLMLSATAFGKAHIYMLPSSTIQIDGSTEVTYKFQMLSPSFEPVKNYKGIVKLSNGQEASLSAKKSGIYTASFTFDENTKTEVLQVNLCVTNVLQQHNSYILFAKNQVLMLKFGKEY